MKNLLIFLTLIFMGAGIVACEKDGPAERAGEKIDEVTTDVGNAVEDACEDVKESAGAENSNC
ncbi:hypothetical protein NBRC116493_10880 [Aurantivibrio infirmus]